jgi:predicted lipid-binding transport protein (Tim44 family)
MAIALLGYFMTMIGALAGLMLVLNMFFTLAPTEKTREEPHLRPAIAQRAEAAAKAGQWDPSRTPRPAEVADSTTAAASNSAMDQHAAAARAAAEKTKRLKIARLRKQKMLARQREEEENTTAALGYAQEPSYSPPFNPFGTRF